MNNLNDYKTTSEEDEAFKVLEAEMEKARGFVQTGKVYALPDTQHVPAPQPTLESVLKTIGEQFAILSGLLATVINQNQGNSQPTPPEATNLQETVELVLRQSGWFAEMVAEQIDAELVHDAVVDRVDHAVEQYFAYSFDPKDHFDIADAVADRVDDKLEDIVDDRIDQAVEEYMSSATISIERG